MLSHEFQLPKQSLESIYIDKHTPCGHQGQSSAPLALGRYVAVRLELQAGPARIEGHAPGYFEATSTPGSKQRARQGQLLQHGQASSCSAIRRWALVHFFPLRRRPKFPEAGNGPGV